MVQQNGVELVNNLTGDAHIPAADWDRFFETFAAGPGLRLGEGSTVAVVHGRRLARQHFVAALNRVIPDITHSLVSEEGLGLREKSLIATAALYEWADALADPSSANNPLDSLIEASREASAGFERHIDRWQYRYRLTEPWLRDATMLTVTIVAELKTQGTHVSVPLMVDPRATPHRGREQSLSTAMDSDKLRFGPRSMFADAPVFIDDLRWAT